MVAFRKAGKKEKRKLKCLTTETVEGAALSFQSVDNIHGSNSLALGVLGVGDGITDHILQEDLQNTTSLLVDEARDSLHTTTAGETTDGWLGDPLDVVTKNLPVALSTTLSETFASLSTSRHDSFVEFFTRNLKTMIRKQLREIL